MNALRVAALDLPGLVHGFETRLAGAPGTERERGRQRVQSALASHGRVFFLSQVHGCDVLTTPWEGAPEGDAGLARRAGDLVAVETADCVPILLADPGARLAAAVHAGWRGAAQAIVARAVEALVAAGARPERLWAAVGPSIGACCYEVDDALRARFRGDEASFFRPGPAGRPHLDLRAVNEAQLLRAGLDAGHVGHLRACTRCDAARLPSYRRDGADCGRIVSYVGWRRSTVEA